MTFSTAENNTIQALETLSSTLSFIGCSATLYYMIKGKKYETLTNNLLLYLLFIDIISCVFYGVGVSGTKNDGFCQLQGLIVQWFGLAGILWVSYMSIQMYRWIVKKAHPNRILKPIRIHFLIIMMITGVLGLILLGLGFYDNATVWCWIGSQYTNLRFSCFYFILLPAWVITIVVLNAVSMSLRKRVDNSKNDTSNSGLHSSEQKIQRKLTIYIVVFIFTWFFPLLNRFLAFIYNKPIYATTVLQAAVLPLRGFLNSAVYGNSFIILYDLLVTKLVLARKPRVSNDDDVNESLTYHEIDVAAAIPVFTLSNYTSKQLSIFITTFNFGEAPFEKVAKGIASWIVKGHDMYVIGFQECLDVSELKQTVLEYVSESTQYAMFSNEIGSGNTQLGYHGYIGLFVLAKLEDLKSGDVIPTSSAVGSMASGTNLIVAKAQNKGATGLCFQINDTSIAFVSCHLPSDSKGKSKLSKRNASAQSLLKELNLTPEDIGFDAQFQHDHLIVIGDFNYRMDTEGIGGLNGLLSAVVSACSVEKDTIVKDRNSKVSWLKKKYDLLRSHKDPLYPSEYEQRLLLEAKANSRDIWSEILSSDELHMIMEGGDAFYGFFEPLPCFPPSYKRQKYQLGDCGDYTDINKLLTGFSNIGQDHLLLSNSSSSQSSDNSSFNINSSSNSNQRTMSTPSSSSSVVVVAAATTPSKQISRLVAMYESATSPSNSPKRPSSAPLSLPSSSPSSQKDNSNKVTVTTSSSSSSSSSTTTTTETAVEEVDATITSLDDNKIDLSVIVIPTPDQDLNQDQHQNGIEIHDLEEGKISPNSAAIEMNNSIDATLPSPSREAQRRVAFNSVTMDISSSGSKNSSSKEDASKIRPPSYTDRILIHSLEDRKEMITVQAYDLCDTMRVSDHRPVCMTLRLEVNGNIKYPENALEDYRTNREGVTVGMYELSILNLSVFLGDTFIDDSDNDTTMDDDDDTDASADGDTFDRSGSRTRSNTIISTTSSDKRSSSRSTFLPVALHNLQSAVRKSLETTYSKSKRSSSSADQTIAPLSLSPSSSLTSTSSSSDIDLRKKNMSVELAKQTLNSDDNKDMSVELRKSPKDIEKALFEKPTEKSQTVSADSAWRLKVEEDQRLRQLSKNDEISHRLKKGLAKKLHLHLIKDKKTDKFVSNVTIVFPLPSKDPLLTHRKIHDVAEAFEANSSQLFSAYKDIAERSIQATPTLPIDHLSTKVLTKESIPLVSKDGFLRPSSTFAWIETNKDLTRDNIQSIDKGH